MKNKHCMCVDTQNHRVMKWNRDANQGIAVAGGQGRGGALIQFSYPQGLFVDTSHAIYVADARDFRVECFLVPMKVL